MMQKKVEWNINNYEVFSERKLSSISTCKENNTVDWSPFETCFPVVFLSETGCLVLLHQAPVSC